MSRPTKPGLGANGVEELVAEVSASDRQQARAAVAEGVQAAKSQWLEARFIAEALTLELVDIARTNGTPGEIAAQLRALADVLEAQVDMH